MRNNKKKMNGRRENFCIGVLKPLQPALCVSIICAHHMSSSFLIIPIIFYSLFLFIYILTFYIWFKYVTFKNVLIESKDVVFSVMFDIWSVVRLGVILSAACFWHVNDRFDIYAFMKVKLGSSLTWNKRFVILIIYSTNIIAPF